MLTFDITPGGAHIVFDRLRQNSDVVFIDSHGKNNDSLVSPRISEQQLQCEPELPRGGRRLRNLAGRSWSRYFWLRLPFLFEKRGSGCANCSRPKLGMSLKSASFTVQSWAS